MPVAQLILRDEKGSALTHAETDRNWRRLRDAINALEALGAITFNSDGTLKTSSVGTNALVNRSVTVNKLAFNSHFYLVATGTADALEVSNLSGPDGVPTLKMGGLVIGSVLYVKTGAAPNTGAATLKVDDLAAAPIVKLGGTALYGGDLPASSIAILLCDGTSFVLLNVLSNVADPAIIALLQASIASASWLGNVAIPTQVVLNYGALSPWTAPAGVTRIRAKVWGSGGGGDTSYGGGAGGYGEGVFTVVPGNAYAVVIGQGQTPNVDGEASSLGALISATGGLKGGSNGLGGTSAANINVAGGAGALDISGGFGGDAGGGGGAGGPMSVLGESGAVPGGGSGVYTAVVGTATGGHGRIIIEYYAP